MPGEDTPTPPQINIPETPPADPNYNSFIQDVLSGGLPNDELEPRLRAQNGFALDVSGRRVKRSSEGTLQEPYYAYEGIKESRSVTPGQAEVIRGVAGRVAERKAQLASGDTIELAREVASGGLGNGLLLERAKQAGYDDLTIASLQSLGEARGQSVDEEANRLVEEFLETGDDTALLAYVEDRRVAVADVSDTGTMRRDIGPLETYAQAARQVSVRSRFWKAAKFGTEGGTDIKLSEAFRILEEFQPTLSGDNVVVAGLRAAGLELRRDNFLLATFQSVAGESPDFEQAALLLKGMEATTGQLGDAELFGDTLARVADTVYSAEIASIFRGLIGQVQLDRATVGQLREAVSEIKPRPPVGEVDFLDKLTAAKADFEVILTAVEGLAIQREVVEIKKRFIGDPDLQGVIDDIIDLPEGDVVSDALRQELIDELSFLTSARKGIAPKRFEDLRALAIDGIRRTRQASEMGLDLTETPEARNIEAVRTLVRRFKGSVMPLFETIRGGSSDGGKLLKYIATGDRGTRNEFVQDIERLEEQRPLSETERAYLESVELLSLFNPHLVALARERPELTSLFLEQYFGDLDRETRESLTADVYVPLIQIGLGPNGVASAGELVRSNPDLASQTLYIDGAALPGGPFGQVKGLGWSLNSANSIGRSTNVLPDSTDSEVAGAAVRSYGSPLVMYPGERRDGEDTRAGSINVSVDYLLNPDNVSTTRYPDNADLARVLQLQSALLVDHVLLSTRVTRVEPVDDGLPGNKRVTIEFQTESGETIVSTIRTDGLIVSSGLGEPNYGINLPGSQAERLLDSEQNTVTVDGFPVLTDTLGAFEALSSPETEEPVAPQGTIVIYGGGNSADVLIEYLGRQFESDNPALDGVEKVYVVTGAPLSARPRYAAINDLKQRGGKKNFLEIVDARVADVALESDGRAVVLDQAGRPITITTTVGETVPLRADHVIAASGFRPELDEVFAPLLSPGESLDRRQGTDKIVLPTNPGVSVADQLIADPDVIFVGTASRDGFKGNDKVTQLPRQAATALINNGVENAVAIGFRTPDTRAAVRLKFGGWEREKGELVAREREKAIIDTESRVSSGDARLVEVGPLPATRRTVPADSDTLTALLLDELAGTELMGGAPGQAGFGFTITLGQGGFTVNPTSEEVPVELLDIVADAIREPYFQAYALKAIRGRRSSSGLSVRLSFSNGKLRLRDKPNPQNPGDDSSRTYAEVL
ncbi:hypothetical protein E6P97_03110 [Patescibacteria group bacterium]|nr:MAG: hypothetical protein E6P97_03110 [Patescibacteria group bacterium]